MKHFSNTTNPEVTNSFYPPDEVWGSSGFSSSLPSPALRPVQSCSTFKALFKFHLLNTAYLTSLAHTDGFLLFLWPFIQQLFPAHRFTHPVPFRYESKYPDFILLLFIFCIFHFYILWLFKRTWSYLRGKTFPGYPQSLSARWTGNPGGLWQNNGDKITSIRARMFQLLQISETMDGFSKRAKSWLLLCTMKDDRFIPELPSEPRTVCPSHQSLLPWQTP